MQERNNAIVKARLILERQGKVLLLAQTSKNGGKYTLVGGRVEIDEYIKTALIRECFEEIGIKLIDSELTLVHVLHKNVNKENRVTFYFLTKNWQGTIQAKETNKFKGAAWFPIAELPSKTSLTVRHVIEQYFKGIAYSELSK